MMTSRHDPPEMTPDDVYLLLEHMRSAIIERDMVRERLDYQRRMADMEKRDRGMDSGTQIEGNTIMTQRTIVWGLGLLEFMRREWVINLDVEEERRLERVMDTGTQTEGPTIYFTPLYIGDRLVSWFTQS